MAQLGTGTIRKLAGILATALLSVSLIACSAGDKAKTDEGGRDDGTSAAEVVGKTDDEASDTPDTEGEQAGAEVPSSVARMLYLGHASLRITTPEGKVIYVDPYAGDDAGYALPADLILVTHEHYDHDALDKVTSRADDCRVITQADALADGQHQTFDLGYATVEAVEAGNNPNHDTKECVGYVITLSDRTSIYASGDTSRTGQMPSLADRHLDYALYCCDGQYNMDVDEASECARVVGARHDIPYHTIVADGVGFDREQAERFDSPNKVIVGEGEEIELSHDE